MVVVLIIFLIDAILIFTNNAIYFKYGLPIFRKSINVEFANSDLPSVVEFEESIPTSTWPSFVFKRIGGDNYAFRERNFGSFMKYPPVMHGTLHFDREAGNICLVGRVNLSMLTLFGYVYFFFPRDTHTIDAFIFVGLVQSVIYLIQYLRFTTILTAVTNLIGAEQSNDQISVDLRQQRKTEIRNSETRNTGLMILFVLTIIIVTNVIGTGSGSGPYRNLERSFMTSETSKEDPITPDKISIDTQDHEYSRYKGSIDVRLSDKGIELSPRFPSSILASRVMIPITEIAACSKQCGGDNKWDANILVPKTGTEIDFQESSKIVDWCWEHKLPMTTSKERREWLYSRTPLPDRSKYSDQLSSKDAYFLQARQSCLGY